MRFKYDNLMIDQKINKILKLSLLKIEIEKNFIKLYIPSQFVDQPLFLYH